MTYLPWLAIVPIAVLIACFDPMLLAFLAASVLGAWGFVNIVSR